MSVRALRPAAKCAVASRWNVYKGAVRRSGTVHVPTSPTPADLCTQLDVDIKGLIGAVVRTITAFRVQR
jgi:hypothetical protein